MTAVPDVAIVDLTASPRGRRPLLMVGPSLGTTARTLWSDVATVLADRFHVIGWDLPGHGDSPPATGFDLPALAAAVLAAVDNVLEQRGENGATFHYAGNSVGGAVGLQLLLDAPARVASATLACTGARIGEPSAWRERAAAVRDGGTGVLLDSAPSRWFAAGFVDRQPATAAAFLDDLRHTDASSYAALCAALAVFDVRDRLAEIAAPVLAIAGECDSATPPGTLRHVADGVQHGRLVVLGDVAHLAPVERPDTVAALVAGQASATVETTTTAQVRAAGMRVRREVLGDAHVDRASAAATDVTAEFQRFITEYAWGAIWTRPGLDRRSRSLITLTALVARGHHEELAMHVRAARANGLTGDEIKELVLQTAVYCGVPEANAAFRVAQTVLGELDRQDTAPSHPEPTSES